MFPQVIPTQTGRMSPLKIRGEPIEDKRVVLKGGEGKERC